MSELVICDTNVVIHLAIIFPKALAAKNSQLKLVIHSSVKTELHKLKNDPQKAARLGSVLDSVLKDVPTTAGYALPNAATEQRWHRQIQAIENALPSDQLSAGSSHDDRKFLILAKANQAKLMTNEKTLYNLTVALLGSDRAWRTSDCLIFLLDNNLVSPEEIQKGLSKLAPFQEHLRQECAERMRKRGFNI